MRGHGTEREYATLARLASQVKSPSCVVEIGTFRGKSACYLASETTATVYTIDPHDLPGRRKPTGLRSSGRSYTKSSIRKEAQRNTSALPNVHMVQGFSIDVGESWTGPKVALLYIDGDHREQAVRKDFSAWQRHLTREATVVFDDHTEDFPGVLRVAARLQEKGLIEPLEQIDGLLVTRRRR